ncbi:MAG: hypothetical protein QM642_10525 [Edaphocola sp.]
MAILVGCLGMPDSSQAYTETGSARISGYDLSCPGLGICFTDYCPSCGFISGGLYWIPAIGRWAYIYSESPVNNDGNDVFVIEETEDVE